MHMGKDVEKSEPLCIVGGDVKWCSLFGKPSAIPLIVKHRVTIWLNNSIPRYKLKRNKNICLHKTCSQMFIAELFIIAKKRKQAKYSSTDEQTNKMWSILAMEYYSTIKRIEALIYAAIWMNLENIILRGSKSQRTT